MLQEKRMDEAVASSDSLEQNTLSRLFQKTDVVPGECPASPEDPPEEIVLQVCCSTEVQPAVQPADQHRDQPKDPRDTQRVSQEGEKALKNEQKRQKSGYLRENSLAGRCWKEWKQRVAYGTVTPRWEKEVCYRIPFKEQVPQTYPLLGTML